MPKTLYINGRAVKAVAINGQNVKSIGDGVNELWEKAKPNYLYFEDRSGEANSISITKTGDTAEWLALEYSTDKNTWTSWDFSQTLTLPANGKVYLRGDNTSGFGLNSSNYHTLDCTGNYAVGGDITSVLSANATTIPDRFGSRTFQGSATLVDIFNLVIPNMPVGTVTFTWMFANCTNLVTVMENIPVTYYSQAGGGANSQFYMMFNGSNSVSNFPKFSNIARLDNSGMRAIMGAPAPNVNTSLTYVDLANIETLYTNALYGAFNQCQSLEVIKLGISAWGDFVDSSSAYYNSTYQWVRNVHSTGVFCKNSTLPVTRGENYIPANWSIADLNGKLYAPVITNTNNTITIAEAEGGASCEIYYTTDGTTPTTSSTMYTAPFTVSAGTTVKAIAHYSGQSAAYVSHSDVAVLLGEPTMMFYGSSEGIGAQSICSGSRFHQWRADIKTPGVEGVTYYINYLNSATSGNYPNDPTTTVHDMTAAYSGQAGCVEGDSEAVVSINVCTADMVGDYLDIAVIGVADGNVSSVSYLEMQWVSPV